MQRKTVLVVGPDQRVLVEQPPTPGMIREQAFAGEGYWVGIVRSKPGQISGWHHGNYDTFVYSISGHARVEFGRGGEGTAEANVGHFTFIPKGVVHRESNPGNEEQVVAVFRVGSGIPMVNVEGPEG